MSDALSLTADIVSTHLSRTHVEIDQLPALIRSVYDALTAPAEPEQQAPEPVVPIRKSVFDDHLVCLECGKSFRTLKRHLEREHRITTHEYRARFSLPRDYPMAAPEYTRIRADVARQIGLGRQMRSKRAAGRK